MPANGGADFPGHNLAKVAVEDSKIGLHPLPVAKGFRVLRHKRSWGTTAIRQGLNGFLWGYGWFSGEAAPRECCEITADPV